MPFAAAARWCRSTAWNNPRPVESRIRWTWPPGMTCSGPSVKQSRACRHTTVTRSPCRPLASSAMTRSPRRSTSHWERSCRDSTAPSGCSGNASGTWCAARRRIRREFAPFYQTEAIQMLSHATARDWLIPYADGMLAADERRRIDGHITGCAAFAAAAIAALAAASTAFAAPSALPDNPLYPVKQLEENVRLALTPANERLTLQLQLASERLREAQAMAFDHKTRLAENSLRAFTIIVNDAAVSLRHLANPLAANDALRALHVKLDAIERTNASRDDDAAGIKELVAGASDELDRIEQLETVSAPALVVGEQATPDPTAQVTAKPGPGPTPPDDGENRDRHD